MNETDVLFESEIPLKTKENDISNYKSLTRKQWNKHKQRNKMAKKSRKENRK